MLKGETFPLHWSLSYGFSDVGDPPSISPLKIFNFYMIPGGFRDTFCESQSFSIWEVISSELSEPAAFPYHGHFISSHFAKTYSKLPARVPTACNHYSTQQLLKV